MALTRRGFLRSLAMAALAAAARVYPTPAAPAVVELEPMVESSACTCGGTEPHTLLCWARRLDPERTTAAIAELLANDGPGPLDDIVWVEAPGSSYRYEPKTRLPC